MKNEEENARLAMVANLVLWLIHHPGGPSAAWLLGPLQRAQ